MPITPGAAEHNLNIVIEHAMAENGLLSGGTAAHRLYVAIYEAAYLTATHAAVAEASLDLDDALTHRQAQATAERILRAMVRTRQDEIISAARTMIEVRAAATA